MRKVLFYLFHPFTRYHAYTVSTPGGYLGYYTLVGRVVAFVDTDGAYYFRW